MLTRNAPGTVEIVQRREEPTRKGAVEGTFVIGLAVGAAITLFPAAGIGLATALFEGGVGGAVIGAVVAGTWPEA